MGSTIIKKAVVPAAGLGTRLRPITRLLPKELLPIGSRPLLDYVVEELRMAGIEEALFIVSAQKPQIAAYLGDSVGDKSDSIPTLRCYYAIQEEAKGSGHALLYAEKWVGDDPFVVAFGDCILESDPPGAPLRRLIDTHCSEGADAAILVEQVSREDVSRYGVAAPLYPLERSPIFPFPLRDIVEKPGPDKAPSLMVVAARWTLSPSIFGALRRSLPDSRGEWNIPDALRLLIEDGASAWAAPLLAGEARRDIGSLSGYLEQFVRSALSDPLLGERARKAARELLEKG